MENLKMNMTPAMKYTYKTPLFRQFVDLYNEFIKAEEKGDEKLCYSLEMRIRSIFNAITVVENKKTINYMMNKEPLTKTRWVYKAPKEAKEVELGEEDDE